MDQILRQENCVRTVWGDTVTTALQIVGALVVTPHGIIKVLSDRTKLGRAAWRGLRDDKPVIYKGKPVAIPRGRMIPLQIGRDADTEVQIIPLYLPRTL